MKTSLGVIAIAMVGCGVVTPPAPRAYVTSEADGTVSVVDLQRYEVVSTISVGAVPRAVQITPSGEMIYVATRGGLVVVDLASEEITRNLGGGRPVDRFTQLGYSLILGASASAAVAIADAGTGVVRAELAVGAEPAALRKAEDDTIWVACAGTDEIDVLDTANVERLATIPVGRGPRDLVFSHDAEDAYVANELGGTIGVIDVSERKAVRTIPLPAGARPTSLALTHDDDRLYVAAGDAGVIVIDGRTDQVTDVIAVPGARTVAFAPEGRLLALGADDLFVIDQATGAVVAQIRVGRAPAGIAVSASD